MSGYKKIGANPNKKLTKNKISQYKKENNRRKDNKNGFRTKFSGANAKNRPTRGRHSRSY